MFVEGFRKGGGGVSTKKNKAHFGGQIWGEVSRRCRCERGGKIRLLSGRGEGNVARSCLYHT